jgi:HlyD family secretion protein
MKKRLMMVMILAGVAGLAAAVWFGLRANGRDEKPGRIRISGNIEMTEVNVAFKTAGKLMERTVDEGDRVKQGQVIARLDADTLGRQREREAAGLESARTLLAQAQTSIAWQRASLTADLEQRQAELGSQQARLEELKNGARPQEKLEVRAAVEAAQAELERARRDWERAQTLYKNDDISTAQYDQYRARFDSAAAAVKQVKEREALVLAGAREETVRAASGQVERARGSLRLGEANRIEIERREQEAATRRAEIVKARASLALVDAQLADTVASSPVNGIVLVKAADVGEVLAPGATIVTIGDIDRPWLRGYINETDLGRVKIGAKALVSTDSYPGKTYEGRVTFIASEAEFTPKQIQTQQERVKLVYRVKIELDNRHRELKSNMPADAEIVVE